MRAAFLAIVLALTALLSAHAQAETWPEFQKRHHDWIHRGEPTNPDLGLTVEWLEWRATVRHRTDVWFHRYKRLRAASLDFGMATEQGPPGALHYSGDHAAMWECIHSLEGAWTANTGNGYYGGLQMGMGFMEAYAPDLLAEKGTADHWTPDEQVAVAEAAWATNGYYLGWLYSQWPISGPACT